MSSSRIFIFGATGYAGRSICNYLLKHTECGLIVSSRELEKALDLADKLNEDADNKRVVGVELSRLETDELARVFTSIDVFIQAGPALDAISLLILAKAVIAAGAHWVDLQLPSSQHETILSLEKPIKQAELTFATQGGFHPGLPAVMVRWAAKHIPNLEKARVSAWLNPEEGLPVTSGIPELIDALRDYKPKRFRDGSWDELSTWSKDAYKKVNFAFGAGEQYVSPMHLDEIYTLPPSIPSLNELSFAIGGFNPITNYVIGPIMFGGLKMLPMVPDEMWGKMLAWSTQKFPKPPYGTILQLDAAGETEDGRESIHLAITLDDAYDFTAIPVVAYLMQLLDGSLSQPGAQYMAMLPEPDRFFADMETMGVESLSMRRKH